MNIYRRIWLLIKVYYFKNQIEGKDQLITASQQKMIADATFCE